VSSRSRRWAFAAKDLLSFGLGAGQAVEELPRKAGYRERVVGAEQQSAGAELGVAVFQRREPVADGVDEELVQVLADRPGQAQLAREWRAGLAVDGQALPQPGQHPAEMRGDAKLGVGGRAELTAKLFHEHIAPQLDDQRVREFGHAELAT
jgi:hypothetical protein